MEKSSPRTLLHVLRNDALGGLEHSTYEVVRFLAEQGVHQHVVFLSPISGGISVKFRELGIPIISIPFTRKGIARFFLEYAALLRRVRPEVQLVNGSFGLHAPLAVLAWLTGVKRRWTYLVMGPPMQGVPWLAQFALGHLARPFSAGEICVSQHLKGLFSTHMRLPPSRVVVIPRWRPLAEIRKAADAARRARTEPGPVVSTVTRLDWTKDIAGMIDGFALFLRAEPKARFMIAGDGELRARLEAQVSALGIADHVFFLGHRRDVPEIIGSSDLFLFMTSPLEGFGNVLIEAMATATPVVCTDVGPCREVLGDGVGGVLIPPGNAPALAASMLELWLDEAARAALSTRATEYAFQHYSAANAGPRLMQVLYPDL